MAGWLDGGGLVGCPFVCLFVCSFVRLFVCPSSALAWFVRVGAEHRAAVAAGARAGRSAYKPESAFKRPPPAVAKLLHQRSSINSTREAVLTAPGSARHLVSSVAELIVISSSAALAGPTR